MLKHKVHHKDFTDNVVCHKNIEPNDTRSYYHHLANLEYLSVVHGGGIIDIQIDVILNVLDDIRKCMIKYYEQSKHLKKKKDNDKFNSDHFVLMTQRKSQFCEETVDDYQSMIEWCSTQTAAIMMQEVCQYAGFPVHLPTEQEIAQATQNKIPIPPQYYLFKMTENGELPHGVTFVAEHFSGAENDKYKSRTTFDVGVARTASKVAGVWHDYEAKMHFMIPHLFDATMSLTWCIKEEIDMITVWIRIWNDIKRGLLFGDKMNNEHVKWLIQLKQFDNVSDPEICPTIPLEPPPEPPIEWVQQSLI